MDTDIVLEAAEIKKRSLRGVFSYLLRTILLTGVSLVAMLFLGARLRPEEYGVYGLVTTITGFFTIISDIGLAASIIQEKQTPTIRELRTVFTVQQVLAWIIFAFILAISTSLRTVGKLDNAGVFLSLAFGISFPLVSLKTISSILLERELRFDRLIIPAIIETVAFNVVAVVLAFRGYGIMSFTYAVLVRTILGVIVMLMLKRWSAGIEFSWADFKRLMRVGGGFQLNDMLAKTKDDLFYISVALILPSREYGFITWAKQWSRQPYALTVDNITAITFPAFSRLQHDEKLLRKAVEKTIFFVTLIAFPLFGGMSAMISPFIRVFPVYMKWQPALLSLVLFCISLAFAALSTPLISTLNAIGKINVSLKMMVFWTVSQWAMAPFLLHWFGFNAIALISAILGVTSLFVVALVYHYVKFDFLDQIWRQTLATMVMVALLWITRAMWSQSVVMLMAGTILGGVLFATLMVVTGYKKVWSEIRSLLRK
ncbi:MAG TPA: oligosaccharide flippase family protein [Patescibacteria group bacterium]|nr:oligosaccharide flippase family protein [Patescibacteria group bacterium]